MYNSSEMYIIPKKYDAAKVRLSIKKKMAAEGKLSVIVPKLCTLYDVALEKSGLGKGTVIMKEDFFCLLDQIEELPDKFKRNNRNYKSAIFALLNEMSFDSEALDSYPFHGTVHAAGLTREHCSLIFKTVRSRGFLFRAEVYRKALEAIDETANSDNEKYYLIPGEYYTRLEKQLLEKLGAEVLQHQNKNQALCRAMFEEDENGDFQIEQPEKTVGFLRSESVMEQYIAVKNHVLETMRKDPSLRLDDFCLVLGTDDSLSLCTSYYGSIGFHPVSSSSAEKPTPLQEGLTLVSYVLSGDTGKIIRWYNRHHSDDKVIYDSSFDFDEFWKFSAKLEKSDGSRYDKLKSVPSSFKEWIKRISGIKNTKQSPSKNLRQLQAILKTLESDEESLYEYESSLNQVFRDADGNALDVSLKDLTEYFRNILKGRRRTMISTWDDGIPLVKMGEYIPSCRFIYFADLEENTFLKDKMPNLLLTSDEHDEFNRLVYGCTKEEHLKKSFCTGIAGAERIFFVVPFYDEGTVVSEYVENALRLFPQENRKVTVIGSGMEDFEHKFYRTFKNVQWENAAPDMAESPDTSLFAPCVKEGDPLEYVLSKLTSATKIEPFMRCPARFIHDMQSPVPQLKDEVHFTKGNAFHRFCQLFFAQQNIRIFKMSNPVLAQEIALYLSSLPCDQEIAEYLDSLDVWGMFNQVCHSYPDLELKDSDLYTYLLFVCRCMKEIMKDCDSSSIRLEVFIGGALLLEKPSVRVGEGYIDMMFRTTCGSVVLVDFKSADISEYQDEVDTFSTVQLLIYSHIVEDAISDRDFSVFVPTAEQQQKMSDKGKDESSVLEASYFDSVMPDAAVASYYVSYKNQDGFKQVKGIPDSEEPFSQFRKKLAALLDQAAENMFNPSCNKDCTYCPLNPFCPDRESGISIDEVYRKLDLKGPFFQDYPVPQDLGGASGGPDLEPVRIIQFAEKAKYSAVADTQSDIIISAGAGAGKTEVLTTRYLNLLLNTDAELENILCITFTEKAAGEMKKRIFAKIRDTLSLGAFYSIPSGGQERESYSLTSSQIQKLKRVHRSFFRNNRISTFHSFCLNMLTRFEKENPLSQRDLTSTVADEFMIREKKISIIEDILNSYAKKYDIFHRWIQYQTMYFKSVTGEWGTALDVLNLLNSIKLSGMPLTDANRDYLMQQFDVRKKKAVEQLCAKFKRAQANLLNALESLMTAESNPKTIGKIEAEIDRVSSGSSGKENNIPYKDNPELKALLKVYQSLPYPGSEECCTAEEEQTVRSLIFDILMETDRQIEKYKIENNIIELSDYHINLISLMENSSILDRIKGELVYIMVDEFQDTNWLQKKILDRLHDNHNHLFVVGDLKQSIYRFQQCDNQIFKQYRDQDNMLYITFQENFRSVSQIVDFNNQYFSRNQVPEYQIIPNTSKAPDFPEFSIPRRSAAPGPAITFAALGYPKEELHGISRKDRNALLREQEAFYIAHTIAASGKENYGRWGILVREYTNMSYILDALQRLDIPYSFCIKKDFFRQSEIVQVLQVLQVLYGFLPVETLDMNPVLSDFVAKYDQKDKGFCYAVSSLMKLPLYAPVRPMLHQLLLQCCDFVRQCGENPEEIMTQLLNFASENSKEISVSALENGVQIMTVHSSKGLEFDYLFVSKITGYTGKGGFGGAKPNIDFINYVDKDGTQIIDYDITGFKTLVKDDRPLFYDAWIKDKNAEFEGEEKGNLLYVAFTRAKKHLVVTMQRGEFKKDVSDIKPDVNWLNNILGNMPAFPDVSQTSDFDIRLIEPVLKKDEKKSLYPVEIVELPVPELATTSVSRYLDMQEEEYDLDDKISDAESEVPEVTGPKANEVGTAVHSFFEENVQNLSAADPAQFAVPRAMQNQFRTFASAGLSNAGFQALVSGADTLMAETAMIFRTPEGNLLNGVIDLIVRKGNRITVLDYKTHTGRTLDSETLARYKQQVGLYAHGLKSIYPGCTFGCCLLVMYSTGASELVWC